MDTIKKFSKICTAVMLLVSALLSLSCTTDPGSLEAINSASAERRNIIGIEICNITDEQRVATKYAGEGVYVGAVIPNHPASIAGLKAGDIIASINSMPVANVSEALTVINDLEAGRRYPFLIYRMRTKPDPKLPTLDMLVFTAHVLIEKVQERAIGRIS